MEIRWNPAAPVNETDLIPTYSPGSQERKSLDREIKKLKGEKDKTRFLPEGISIDPLTELPEPEDWWEIRVVKMYEKKGAQLIAHGMLSILDIEYLGWYCLLGIKINREWEAQNTPSMAMYTQMNSLSAHLGLNPIGRQKFQGPEKSKKGNKFLK